MRVCVRVCVFFFIFHDCPSALCTLWALLFVKTVRIMCLLRACCSLSFSFVRSRIRDVSVFVFVKSVVHLSKNISICIFFYPPYSLLSSLVSPTDPHITVHCGNTPTLPPPSSCKVNNTRTQFSN